jgi:hypothetical protein
MRNTMMVSPNGGNGTSTAIVNTEEADC